MALSPEGIAAIDEYLELRNAAVEERRHKQFLRWTAALGIFAATLAGAFAWAINSISTGLSYNANLTAITEVSKYLSSAPTIQDFRNRLQQANDSVIQAAAASSSARRVATESESAAQQLQETLKSAPNILKTLNDITKFSDDVAKAPEFQKSVVGQLLPEVLQATQTQISAFAKPRRTVSANCVASHDTLGCVARCAPEEIGIGGDCFIESGGGILQNAGMGDDNSYACTWFNAPVIQAHASAWCVKRPTQQ
jgi:cell fate (sporulation/competence/biofilm development) regulator YmcA (YheA/YmcA/DUF963 family)